MTTYAPPGYLPPPTPTPQYPAAPSYPGVPGQLPAYPQQYAPPAQYPMPGYPAPQPQAPLAQGSIDDFYSQPTTGGGKALTFNQPGETYIGIVSRAVTQGDVQQQTDTMGRPQFFKDSRPKFVLKVPLQMQPTAAFPDGVATWYVKGAARDELVRAMAEAGAPSGAPEANAVIQVTFTGTRQSGPGLNPAKLFAVRYQRPAGAAPAAPPAYAAQTPAPAAQPVGEPVAAPAPPVAQQPIPPAAVQQAFAGSTFVAPQSAPMPQPAPQSPLPPPPNLDAAQQQLLAQLTGQQS